MERMHGKEKTAEEAHPLFSCEEENKQENEECIECMEDKVCKVKHEWVLSGNEVIELVGEKREWYVELRIKVRKDPCE